MPRAPCGVVPHHLCRLGTMRAAAGATAEVTLTGSAPNPVAVLCPVSRELLLARDKNTFFHCPEDGRFSRRRHLQWSAPLLVGDGKRMRRSVHRFEGDESIFGFWCRIRAEGCC